MKKLFLFLACLLYPALGFGIGSATGFCEQGNQTVTTQGLTSVTKVQKSYPSCTITVFLPGTVTFATIYSDNAVSPTRLDNPFTSNANGSWQFYAANGAYDIVKSGGTPSPGISPAVTTFSVSVFDPSAATGLVLDATSPKYGTGTDICLRINTAIGFLPASTGGTIDARGFQGATSCTSDMFAGVTKPGVLLLPAGTPSVTVPQNVPAGWIIAGSGRGVTIWNQTINATTGGGETPGDGFRIAGNNVLISEMNVRGAAGTNPAASAAGANGFIWRNIGTSNNTIMIDVVIERFNNRGIQEGTSATGLRFTRLTIQDVGDEGILLSPNSEAVIRDSEVTRYGNWGIDINSSNVQTVDNYIHDSNAPLSVNDAGGITYTSISDLFNGSIQGNKISNLSHNTRFIDISAAVGTTVSNIQVIGNSCYSAASLEVCTYYEEVPNGAGGTIRGIVTSGNTAWNARFYCKAVEQSAWNTNITITTLDAMGSGLAGFRLDTTLSGITLNGNTSIGWDEGAHTVYAGGETIGNYFTGLTTAYNNLNSAPYISMNVLPGGDTGVLLIRSTVGSIYPAAMTDTQRGAISPSEGLIIDNTTRHEQQFYNGTSWNASVPLVNPAYSNSWVDFGSGLASTGYWKDQNGYVHLVGNIKNGTNGTTVFTLPSGFRPPNDVFYSIYGVDGTGATLPSYVRVFNNGGVMVTVVNASGGVVDAAFGHLIIPTAYDK